MPKDAARSKTATLYRMAMADHMCPYGLKSKDLLERQGCTVDDRHLSTRQTVDTFKAEHDVKSTPRTFIGTERIGGHEDPHNASASRSIPRTRLRTSRQLHSLELRSTWHWQ